MPEQIERASVLIEIGDIGFGTGGHQNGARRQVNDVAAELHIPVGIRLHAFAQQALDVSVLIQICCFGIHPFGVVNTFFHCLGNFFVVADISG